MTEGMKEIEKRLAELESLTQPDEELKRLTAGIRKEFETGKIPSNVVFDN